MTLAAGRIETCGPSAVLRSRAASVSEPWTSSRPRSVRMSLFIIEKLRRRRKGGEDATHIQAFTRLVDHPPAAFPPLEASAAPAPSGPSIWEARLGTVESATDGSRFPV